MNTDENMTASADPAGDNLEEIEGIGPGYAKALNRIGIYQFVDLLQYNIPDELHQALEEAGEKVPLWKIENGNWLGQAREKVLARQSNAENPSSGETAEEEREREKLSTEEEWQQYVGFNLYFEFKMDEHGQQEWRTLVYKTLDPDSFNGREEFPGVESAPWVNWILENAELPIGAETSATETEVAAEPIPIEIETVAASPPATEDVSQIKILEVQLAEIGPSSGVPEKRLKAEVRFKVVGPQAETLAAERIPFRSEVHTVALEEGISSLVASGLDQLQPQVFEYTAQQTFPIPELGRYELHSVVFLLPPHEMMASYQGPTLKVVP